MSLGLPTAPVEDPARIRRAIERATMQTQCMACAEAVEPPAFVAAFHPIGLDYVFIVPVCPACRDAHSNPETKPALRLLMTLRMWRLKSEAHHAR